MAKRQSISQEVKNNLNHRKGFNRSKHLDKIEDKKMIDQLGDAELDRAQLNEKFYFYRQRTFDDCVKKGVDVLRFCKEKYGRRIAFSDVKEDDIKDYLNERKKMAENGNLTPRSLAKERSQVSKVFQIDLVDKVEILPCTAESDKGRGADPHFNPANHEEQLDFYRMIGARKGEYHFLNAGEQKKYIEQAKSLHPKLEVNADAHGRVSNIVPKFNEDGTKVTKVMILHAKHGKTNISEIHPADQAKVAEIFNSGKYADYYNPSDHTNVHACRRDYAMNLYQHFARNVLELPEQELYRCRDGSGRCYDRQALSRVAKSLGHAPNDLFDTVHNYLR